MGSAIFLNGKRFEETKFSNEDELEGLVKSQSKLFFGERTVYLDLKKKIESKTLGGAVPDAIMFDLTDSNSPEVYLVEVELASHSFYNHIFPQITKFFTFYNNSKSRNNLIEVLYGYINSNTEIRNEFKKLLDGKELYKTIKDTFEDSQNILIIIDEQKPEFQEMFETYIDTWGKMVKVEVLKEYTVNNDKLFSLTPDFTGIELVYPEESSDEGQTYDETYHLSDVSDVVKSAYQQIKQYVNKLDSEIIFNPQRYYISLRKKKNFAYIKPKKKKLKIVVGMPYEEGKEIIKRHTIKQNSQAVQNFYHMPCFQVLIDNTNNLKEVFDVIEKAYIRQEK